MADEDLEPQEPFRSENVALVRRRYPRAPIDIEPYDDEYGYGADRSARNTEFLIRDTWRKVRKHKLLIITLIIIATTLTTIEMYRQKPTYLATTIIELGKEEYAPVKPSDVVLQDPDQSITPGSIKTKMFIIKSDPLLENVVLKLSLDKNPNYWSSRKRSFSEALNTLIGQSPDTIRNRQLVPVIEDSVGETADKMAPGSKSPQVTSEMLEPYVAYLRSGLNVENIKDTQLLSISFTHTSPEISESVANGVANAFIERSFENKTEKFTKSSDWLSRQTRELQAKVEESERALADYTRDHNLFSTEGKESLTGSKLASLHDQALRAQVDRMLKETLYQEAKAGRVSQLPESFSDPAIIELQRKQRDLTLQASQLVLSYGPLNPRVIEVKEQANALQQQIDKSLNELAERLRSDYERALRNEESLNAALQQAKSEATEQNQLAIQFSVLRQNVDTTKGLYTDFLQRASQAKIQVAEQHNNVRVIQPAKLPKSPVGPNRLPAILGSMALSLMVGVGLALLIEYLDRSIKTADEVVRYTQLPALGIIPTVPRLLPAKGRKAKKAFKSKDELSLLPPEEFDSERLIALDVQSAGAEAYRGLRTSILLSAAEQPPKSILVTSGRAGEGKTTTTVNMAVSLAQLGASVLVIDCDLRRPAVHKVLGVSHSRGLSTYLSRDMEIATLLQQTEVKNLWVLPCGPIPPNPAELMSSAKMKRMLKLLGEQFDHILLDSPPVLNVTDPVVLSTLVDGVIVVAHGGKSTRDDVRRACQELVNVGAKSYGVVLNNIDMKREGYTDGYAHYYYRTTDESQETEA